MSVFIDTEVRHALSGYLVQIGSENGSSVVEREVDLSGFGFGLTTHDIYISRGEDTGGSLPQDRTWLEHFLVKSPQRIITRGSECGLSRKQYQFTVWVKSDKGQGTYTNEFVAGLVEEHFPNNTHITLPSGNVLTILKTYQQATVTQDSNSGRLFNRVYVDCEVYYKNNK